ncbi:glycosyltransferase family 4 protein [Chloroflexi bacterium TSY]|nr:glycosyltransferase family 4 protein [Chloroflexi bacterium TSY]
MMRILQITAYYPPDIGGIQYFVQNLSRALTQRGHDVDVLTVKTDSGPEVEKTDDGVFVRRCKLDLNLYRAVVSRKFIGRLMTSSGYDAYHIHIPFHLGLETAALAARRHKTSLVATHHGQGIDGSLLYRAIAQTYNLFCHSISLRTVDRTVFLTESYRCSFWLPQTVEKRVRIVRTGAEIQSFGAEADGGSIRQKYNIPQRVPLILWVGRLHRANRYKGVDYLLRAMQQVLAYMPEARLLVVGDGELLPELKNMASELTLDSAVIFAGAINNADLPAYYAASDLLTLPSISGPENAPVVVFEAMAAGKPVIASDIPGVCEIVEHQQSGLLVPPRDVDALSQGIVQVLQDRRFCIRPIQKIKYTREGVKLALQKEQK